MSNPDAEKKKALLVYKSNQQSASDDDEEDDEDAAASDDDSDDDDDDEDDGEEDLDLDDAASVHRRRATAGGSAAPPVGSAPPAPPVDDDEEGEDVDVDDDESTNAPSDDDLDSTATPLRAADTDEEVAHERAAATTALGPAAGGSGNGTQQFKTDDGGLSVLSPSTGASGGGQQPGSLAPTTAAPAPATGTLKSGDLSAIIAARRRTGARKECEVCQEPRNGRRAMLCTNCKCMYHSSCFRQRYSKLISSGSGGKQWFCPDCEPIGKADDSAERGDGPASTPRKKPTGDSNRSRSSRSSSKGGAAAVAAKAREGGDAAQHSVGGAGALPMLTLSAAEAELKRVTEIALRGGKQINSSVLERTEEMLQVVRSLTSEIDGVVGRAWHGEPQNGGRAPSDRDIDMKESSQPPPFTLPVASSASSSGSGVAQEPLSPVPHSLSPPRDAEARATSDATEKDVLLTRVYAGLVSLKHLLEQMQVTGIQFEVDLIKEITLPSPAANDEHRSSAGAPGAARKPPSARAAASASALNNKAKNGGATRLYSSKQIQKLEDWYQKSSRPESSEIHAMYRIINSPEYADKELQPEGISVKQIRIWFDNRRAKERLDYMRLKMKTVSTASMDVESVKRMKAAYIDEAKEVLEARVTRLRESLKGPGEIVDEAGDLLLAGSGEHALPVLKSKASTGAKTQSASHHASIGGALLKDSLEGVKSVLNVKKRIRVDFVASVRKVVKDAREAGKSEEEIKALRTVAIDRARERLHVPYKNARQGPLKPLGKDEVTHIKLKMLKLLEEDASAEELTDVIELLMSVMIPREILIESALHRQLTLVLKAHKDNKELIKQTNKLLDEYNMIVEKGDSVFDSYLLGASSNSSGSGSVASGAGADRPAAAAPRRPKKKKQPPVALEVDTEAPPGSPCASPGNSPAAASSPDSRRPRVKFSLEQLVKLEKYFHKDDTPSKKKLDKLADKLNEIGARDPSSDDAQKSIDYKQIRCWFYKRRSTNQRPQALTALDLEDASVSSSLSSDTESDSDDSVSSRSVGKGKSVAKRKAAPGSTDSKAPASKRSKKDAADSGAPDAAVSSTTAMTTTATGTSSSAAAPGADDMKHEAVSSASSASRPKEAGGKQQHPGRIFNVKQLATIIEEYEKNPRPSVARMNELQVVLNQGDHADDHFANPGGVTKRQIKTWFSNRRAKERLDLIKMKVQDGGAAGSIAGSGGSETEDDGSERKPTKRKAVAGASRTRGDNGDPRPPPVPPSAVASTSKMPMSMLVDDDSDDDDDDSDDA
ncbi:hypothetical protein PybrP1_000172 [[Pythium] brassicae (nom. inval.)]|nr:hypothetical protein PybrP1_000172 [[Pythium] brassicae (nom. inval.)]